MKRDEPYQTPEASSERPKPPPPARPIRAAMRRGAKGGAVIAGGLMATVVIAVTGFIYWLRWQNGSPLMGLHTVTTSLPIWAAEILLVACAGAVLGAIIGGAVAAVRLHRERNVTPR
jgi:hypothetical protein